MSLVETEYLAQVEELTKEFLMLIQAQLQAYLANNNRNASGSSSQSIQVANLSENGGQLVGSSAIQWVFTGRGPGRMPPISNIIDWLNARCLPRSIAWAVARNIAQNGTKLFQQGGKTNNGLTEVITQDKIDIFAKSISDLLALEISSDISGIIK